jgi:Ca2+-binding EF-hand superfamily protein
MNLVNVLYDQHFEEIEREAILSVFPEEVSSEGHEGEEQAQDEPAAALSESQSADFLWARCRSKPLLPAPAPAPARAPAPAVGGRSVVPVTSSTPLQAVQTASTSKVRLLARLSSAQGSAVPAPDEAPPIRTVLAPARLRSMDSHTNSCAVSRPLLGSISDARLASRRKVSDVDRAEQSNIPTHSFRRGTRARFRRDTPLLPTVSVRRSWAAKGLIKDVNFSKMLSAQLDDMIRNNGNGTQKEEPQPDQPEPVHTIPLNAVREALRQYEVFGRLLQFFRECDTDNSGEVDQKEFVTAVMATVEGCRASDVHELFREFDVDNSGRISYKEMHMAMQEAAEKAGAMEVPQLPRTLQARSRDLLRLHDQFQKNELIDPRAKSVSLPTYMKVLELYYPKDTRSTRETMAKWVVDMIAVRNLSESVKQRERDKALIAALDTDGNGSISVEEFCELSKSTGISRVQLRAHFREKDHYKTGQLDQAQMREVLEELRVEQKKQAKERSLLKAEQEKEAERWGVKPDSTAKRSNSSHASSSTGGQVERRRSTVHA